MESYSDKPEEGLAAMLEQLSPEELAYVTQNLSSEEQKILTSGTFLNSPQNQSASINYRTKKVNIIDNGLGKVMYSVEVPENWQVRQNIHTSAYNGRLQTFQLDYLGPNGEMIRVVRPTTYQPQYGQQFQGTWNQLFYQSLNGIVQNINPGSIQRSQKPLTASSVRKAMNQSPGNYQGFEQSFSGIVNGQAIEGKASIVNMTNNMGGFILATLSISPKGLLGSTLTILDGMNGTVNSNSEAYRQALAHAGQRGLAASAAAHNQKMSQLYAKTNSMVQELRDLQSRDNADFSRNLRSSGTGYNGNPHTANDQFTDYLRDVYTIENPYSGIQEQVDSRYQYWFINAAGERRGTNDPNLDLTNVPGGTWKRAPRAGN